MTTPDTDPLATAQKLTGALTEMSARLDAAVARGNSTRRIAWGLVISVVLDVAFSVVISLLAVQAHNASDNANAATMRAAHASASNLALCRASNVARHQQLGIWLYLFKLSGPSKTAEGRKLVAEFEDRLHTVFAARNCVKLGTRK